MKHKHGEAFMLMQYESDDGAEREVVWNSRDGVTPFIIRSATTGAELTHKNWGADQYAPKHVPKVGDRIFVDLTPQRARWFAAQQVEGMIEHGYRAELEEEYESREAAVEKIAEGLLRTGGGGAPDILVVTDGYLQGLTAQRALVMPPGVLREGEGKALIMDAVTAPPRYFDREGAAISEREYQRLIKDPDYRVVKQTLVRPAADGLLRSGSLVTTEWVGRDHRFGPIARFPLIFVTQVYREGKLIEEHRYSRETEALGEHDAIATLLRALLDANDEAAARSGRPKKRSAN